MATQDDASMVAATLGVSVGTGFVTSPILFFVGKKLSVRELRSHASARSGFSAPRAGGAGGGGAGAPGMCAPTRGHVSASAQRSFLPHAGVGRHARRRGPRQLGGFWAAQVAQGRPTLAGVRGAPCWAPGDQPVCLRARERARACLCPRAWAPLRGTRRSGTARCAALLRGLTRQSVLGAAMTTSACSTWDRARARSWRSRLPQSILRRRSCAPMWRPRQFSRCAHPSRAQAQTPMNLMGLTSSVNRAAHTRCDMM